MKPAGWTTGPHHQHVDRRGAWARADAVIAGHSVLCAATGDDTTCPGPSPLLTLARAASDAVATLCGCLDDCARETGVWQGTRAARASLEDRQNTASNILVRLVWRLEDRGQVLLAHEVRDMHDGVKLYPRPSWALRLVQIAAECEARVKGKAE